MDVTLLALGSERVHAMILNKVIPTFMQQGANGMIRLNSFKARYQCAMPAVASLICEHDNPTIVFVDGADRAMLARLAPLKAKVQAHVNEHCLERLAAAPIIAVSEPDSLLGRMASMWGSVDDWIMLNAGASEINFRILLQLGRFASSQFYTSAGTGLLKPENNTLHFNKKAIRLTPTEYAVAELFVSKFDQVISLTDLMGFFESAGNASGMNNIRVTIYQLRLKIEEVSDRALTITTVYRKGYSLRRHCNLPPLPIRRQPPVPPPRAVAASRQHASADADG